MASKTLVEFAVKNGFYDPKKDGEFNFSKAYCRDDDRDRDYNDPRVWQIQKLLTPSLEQPVQAAMSHKTAKRTAAVFRMVIPPPPRRLPAGAQ